MNNHDLRHAPPYPEGFPQHMLEYHRFMRGRGMTPSEVDDLSLVQLFWLPIISAAQDAAEAQFIQAREKMLTY